MNLGDFLSPEAGQRRTRALHEFINKDVGQFVPPNLREALGLAAQANPVNDIYQAGGNMRDGDYIGAATNTAAAALPLAGAVAAKPLAKGMAQGSDDASRAIVDALTTYQAGAGDAARRFVADEAGSVGRGKLNPAQAQAQEVLDLLKSGRGDEVTDDMLAAADDLYLFENYDLPMDEASRMARAREMGFDTDTPLYHGTQKGFDAFEPSSRTANLGSYFANDADFANSFAENYRGSSVAVPDGRVYPAFSRGDNLDLTDIGPFVGADEVSDFASAAGVDEDAAQSLFEATSGFRGDALTFNMMEDPIVSDDLVRRGGNIDFMDWSDGGAEWNRVVTDPRNIRSRFARFDPRLSHLRNLSAGVGPLGAVLGLNAYQNNQERDRALRDYLEQ